VRVGKALAVESSDQVAAASDAAIREMVAGVASLGGTEGLTDLAADLTVGLAKLIKQMAVNEGRAPVNVAHDLFYKLKRPR
jgi:hypothetical protein